MGLTGPVTWFFGVLLPSTAPAPGKPDLGGG